MSTSVTELVKQYEEKAKALKKQMKNPTSDASTFSNKVDFGGKNIHFSNQGGILTSRHDKLENYFFTGYPYKKGVKRVVNDVQDTQPHYEPHVAVGVVLIYMEYVRVYKYCNSNSNNK